MLVGWLLACLTSKQHDSVSEGRVGVRFVGWLVACLLACLTSKQHDSVSEGRAGVRFVGCLLERPSNMLVYLREEWGCMQQLTRQKLTG